MLPEFAVGQDNTILVCDTQMGRVQIHDGKSSKLKGIFKTYIHGATFKPKSIAAHLTEQQVNIALL